ncbi:MAG: Hsp20/alpha crystallin family protein [Chlamydiota bacterium]
MNRRRRGEDLPLLPSLFEESFLPTFMRNFKLFDENFSQETSNISLWEDENEVNIEVAMPGVDEDNIEITENKGVLWIKGSSKTSEDDEKRRYYYRASNSFSYQVAIPGNIDENSEPKATFKNGVLRISYPKKKAESSKKISISRE